MTRFENPLAHLRTEIIWLHVILADHMEVPAIEAWRQRLQGYLRIHGLIAAISPSRIAVLPFNRPLAPADRGLLLGWLVLQPEVVFLRIEGRSIVSPADLQDLTPIGGVQ